MRDKKRQASFCKIENTRDPNKKLNSRLISTLLMNSRLNVKTFSKKRNPTPVISTWFVKCRMKIEIYFKKRFNRLSVQKLCF